MIQFTSELYNKMREGLDEISLGTEDILHQAERSYKLIGEYIKQLKEFVQKYKFQSEAEEIRFFKEIKPRFLQELFFYIKLFNIETHTPVGSQESVVEYYRMQLDQLRSYFEDNQFLFMYHKMDQTHMDKTLFVRDPEELPLYPNYTLDADTGFSNIYSSKLAKIQAYEHLISYIKGLIESKEGGQPAWPYDQAKKRKVVWKGTKAEFYELVYAVVSEGSVSGDLKTAMEWLAFCLNIKTGNYYSFFQSMRVRKKEKTPYLDRLKAALLKRMDDAY